MLLSRLKTDVIYTVWSLMRQKDSLGNHQKIGTSNADYDKKGKQKKKKILRLYLFFLLLIFYICVIMFVGAKYIQQTQTRIHNVSFVRFYKYFAVINIVDGKISVQGMYVQ